MYGYTPQQYSNFTSAGYTSTAGNQVYGQQQQQTTPLSGLGQTATNVAASNVYSSANYPYSTNTASAYQNYGVAAATQGAGNIAGYASAYKAPTPTSYMGVTRIGGTATTMPNLVQQSLSSISNVPNLTSGVKPVTTSTNQYSGYEAAVYAAASSYLQAKTSGQTNVWMSKKGPGGAGSFPRKRYGVGQTVQQFYCEVCKITCAGQQTYNEHIQGQRHKKKDAANKNPTKQTLPRNKVSFKCDICNVTCTGRDTYDAHVKGGKHQKTMSLMKKMGKNIPTEPTLIPPKEPYGAPIPTVGGASVPTKKVVGVTATKFVGGSRLTTTGVEETTNALEEALAAEKNIQPVGEEYVDTKTGPNGKILEYNCKLCDCKFTDPNAKAIHLKGRRHRLAYKQKVDPSLKVEMKMGVVRKRREIGSRQLDAQIFRPPPLLHPMMMRPWYGANVTASGGRYETMDDKHVIAKAKEIEPNEDEKLNTEKLVSLTEKTLKSISDCFAEQEEKENPKENEEKSADRLLKGVMRVGLLAKNILLKTDKQVELVVLCSKIPTYTLLKQMSKLFPEHAAKVGNDRPTVTERANESSLYISLPGNQVICRVTLTCVSLREPEANGESETTDNIKDPLPKKPCLEALAQLRHAKWYQVKCSVLQSITITMRIIRDISSRVVTWRPLSNWAMELLVEKTLSSIQVPLNPGDAVRRVFEVISSGIILTNNPVLLDPCEKDQVDVLAELTGQQREDITSSAQHALRLIAFNQLYKILAIDRLPDERHVEASANGEARKRAFASDADEEDVGGKKEKTDGNV